MAFLALLAMSFAQMARVRSKDLEVSLHALKTAQARLMAQEKLAALGSLTAGVAHEIKNPLNFINNFSKLSLKLLSTLQENLTPVEVLSQSEQAHSQDLMTLKNNLETIFRHGQRIDMIVEKMRVFSSGMQGKALLVDMLKIIEEAIGVFVGGMDAQVPFLDVALERSFGAAGCKVLAVPDQIMRVLLVMLNNSHYALALKKKELGDDFSPIIRITTRQRGEFFEILIWDNGMGISPGDIPKIFTPFFTTKPTQLGTGLGLAICHNIIVDKHGGSLSFHTAPGQYVEFAIALPL